jgi:hypothetical protein
MELRGRQAAAFAHQHFGLAAMVDQYLAVYQQAAPGHPRGRRPRRRLSPLFDWRCYVDERLGVGHAQLDAARRLAADGRRRLAAGTAREALATAPTMFLNPRRLARLVHHRIRASFADHQHHVPASPVPETRYRETISRRT